MHGAEAAPRHARPLLFCTSSSLTHLLDCAITRLSISIARKRDRGVHGGDGDAAEWTGGGGGGGRDAKEMMCTSCTQLIPTAERKTCVFIVPHISLCCLYLDPPPHASSNPTVDALLIKNDFFRTKNRTLVGRM